MKWLLFSVSLLMVGPLHLMLMTSIGLFCLVLFSKQAPLNLMLGGDYYSSTMVVLTFWVMLLAMASSLNSEDNSFSMKFFPLLGVMCLALSLSFYSMSMFIFYVFFEGVFILMYLMIMGWGYSPERYQSSSYMFFYTLIVSLPFLYFLITYCSWSGTFNFFCMKMTIFSHQPVWWLFIVLVFLVKLPMYWTHLWLPKAHVEAPLAGSMILAGVLLKLGGFGIFRFSVGENNFSGQTIILSLSIISSFVVALLCLLQTDMKALVAYSSVSHMALVIMSLLSYSPESAQGALMLMLGHGLSSSALFLVLFFMYERFHSRSIMVIKGTLMSLTILPMIVFIVCVINLSVPPTINFLSEISIIIGILGAFKFSIFFISSYLFFSGIYSVYMYVLSSHGEEAGGENFPLTSKELLSGFSHIWPAFLSPFILVLFLP